VFWLQKPSILRVCVKEEDAGEGAGRAFYYTYTQREKTVLRGSRAGRRVNCRNHPSCVYV
jgi:hypothetical protein